MNKDIFMAYDIRGIYPVDINEDAVYRIAKAYAMHLKPKKIALGRDVRISGPSLFKAAVKGLTEMGVDVVDIGVVSTDMLYFAVANYGFDGGLTITGSHNAGEYNGIKLVKELAKPISIDSGLADIRDIAVKNEFTDAEVFGKVEKKDILDDYIAKIVSFVDRERIKPLKAVANANFGAASTALQRIADHFSLELVKLNFEQDGTFPKGKPDPMMEANRAETLELIKNSNVDFGTAWDSDADRCFFYDEKGGFIHPYYITGLIMKYFMAKKPGSKFLIDPRLRRLPQDLVKEFGGELIINKSGHSFIKERMRKEDVLFSAETSAHYYFKDLWFTDNGMVPFLIMLEILSQTGKPLSELVDEFRTKYPAIEETNFKVDSVSETIEKVKKNYTDGTIDAIDGFSCAYSDYSFNLRGSNTEPVIRLNLEAKTKELLEKKKEEIIALITNK